MNDLGNEAMEADYQQVNYFDFLFFLIFFYKPEYLFSSVRPDNRTTAQLWTF